MLTTADKLTTFSNGAHYSHYPFEALSYEILDVLNSFLNTEGNQEAKSHFNIVIRCLECFLQISNQSFANINPKKTSKIIMEFIGFLNSSHISSSKNVTRGRTRSAISILIHLADVFGITFTPPLQLDVEYCQGQFSKLALNSEKVVYWRGWPIFSKGHVTYLPIWGLFRSYGQVFTENIYSEAKNYLHGRAQLSIAGLKQLGEFCEANKKRFQPEDFLSDVVMSNFWEEFVVHYVISSYDNGKGRKLLTIATRWNGEFSSFVIDHLVKSGIFSIGFNNFPILPSKYEKKSNLRDSREGLGGVAHTKLIHDIPLEITDSQALYLIFDKLKTSAALLESWADQQIFSHDKRCERRIESAPDGRVRHISKIGTNQSETPEIQWQRDYKNPEYYENAAANFEYHDYKYLSERSHQIMPAPHDRIAYELGLAVSGSLYPHCLLLTLLHNKITPSFLESLELFDKHGKQIGLIDEDSSPKLIGYKLRRGHKLAEIVVHLSSRSLDIVKSIIKITQYARNHLKKNGDDQWRYLLISSVRSFGRLQRPKLATFTSAPSYIERYADSITTTMGVPYAEAEKLVRRSNLSSIRATAAVLKYLEHKNSQLLADDLGHANVDRSLLTRYLPAPIWDFFLERWIRLFQAGIILESMKDSEYCLEASDFNSLDEVETFLRNHAIHLNSERGEHKPPAMEDTLLISLDQSIFTHLLKLESRFYDSSSCIQKDLWFEFSKKILNYVRSDVHDRPDLSLALKEIELELEVYK